MTDESRLIELRVLGPIDLRDDQGSEIRPILAQPRRLALLAYLALRGPRGPERRDTLLGLFWPESDAAHARGALRNALHFLRRFMGTDTIQSRAEEELLVNSGSVRCDAVEFERLLDEDRCAEALELYRGPLLEGFFIAEAPDFEIWLGEERERLRRRAIDAASRLANAAETAGHLALAAHYARRALALSQDDEVEARRLITLLWRGGDRRAALHAYEEFAGRLATAYDLEPAPETVMLVQRLRAEAARETAGMAAGEASIEPASTTPSIPHRVALATVTTAAVLLAMTLTHLGGEPNSDTSPDVVAVFPFTFRGGPEHAFMAEGLVTLLGTSLNEAGDLHSVDSRVLLSFMDRGGKAPRDPESARAIASRFGAGSFVLGEIIETGGDVRITGAMYVRDDNGLRPREVVVQGPAADFLILADRLATGLLAERSGAQLTRAAIGTTRSMAALKSYLAGESARRRGRLSEAMEAFQAAVQADTTFALAYYRLSATAYAAGKGRIPLEAGRSALRHSGRLSRADSLLVAGWVHHLRGELESAEPLYQRAVVLRPSFVEAWEQLGELAFHWGPTLGRAPSDSREAFGRVLELEPQHIQPMIHLARLAAREGDLAEVDSLTLLAHGYEPAGGEWALELEALRAFLSGDPGREQRAIRAIAAAPDRARGILVSVAANTSRLDGAARLARHLLTVGLLPDERAKIEILLAQIEMGRGRFRAAERVLAGADALPAARILEYRALMASFPFRPMTREALLRLREELSRTATLPVTPQDDAVWYRSAEFPPVVWPGLYGPRRLYLEGSLAARLGDKGGVARAIAALDGMQEADAPATARTLRAQARWSAGDPARALGILGAVRLPARRTLETLVDHPRTRERFLRAEVHRRLGHVDDALRWYSTFPDPTGHDLPYLAPSHLARAELLRASGRGEEAAFHYRRFILLWQAADPELQPSVKRARAQLASLE